MIYFNKKIDFIIANSIDYYGIVLLTIFFVPVLIYFFNKICFKFNIIDIPNKRKDHSLEMPVSGGLVLISILSLNLIYFEIINYQESNFFEDIFIISLLFFIVGFIDDTKTLNTNLKVGIIIILIFFTTLYSEHFLIQNLKFNYIFNKTFILEILAIPFTIFCIFMLFNALNFADGKNGIAISLSIFWFIYLLFKINSNIFIIVEILLVLLILLYFNLKNKFFLGNSGVNFLSIFLSLLIIKSYNTQNILFCDEIFLLLLIPGIDAARVTIFRSLNKKSPFEPDKSHLHHFLEKKINNNFIWLVYIMASIFPILVLMLFNNFFISILLSISFYIILLNLKKIIN